MTFTRHQRFCFDDNWVKYRLVEYTHEKVVISPVLIPSCIHTMSVEKFNEDYWLDELLINLTA